MLKGNTLKMSTATKPKNRIKSKNRETNFLITENQKLNAEKEIK